MHRFGDHGLGKVEFKRNETPFRSDHHQRLSSRGVEQGLGCAHLSDPTGSTGTDLHQLILHERPEQPMLMHPGCNGVPRAFHPGLKRLLHLGRLKQRGLPEALVHPGRVDQMKVRHAELRHRSQDPAQHLRPRQSQNDVEAMAFRRGVGKGNPQGHRFGIQGAHHRLATEPIDQADPQLVAHTGPQNAADVIGTSIAKDHAIVSPPAVSPRQQDDVHPGSCRLGGRTDGRKATRTRSPKPAK